MIRIMIGILCAALTAACAPGSAPPVAGASGVGDPYFPFDGNGGYDVGRYVLDVAYDPPTDSLTGTAEIQARATQALSSFNLDLVGLDVRGVTVGGQPATWSRNAGELTITPGRPLPADESFTTVIQYQGVPQTLSDPQLGPSGFFHTDDGALVVGQPDVAATWFPVNDHPSDTAAYTLRITAPQGLEVIANGLLADQRTSSGKTTWTWQADEPMASYLVTMSIGRFQVHSATVDKIRYWDAIDPDLFTVPSDTPGVSEGAVASASLAREPEIIKFLANQFGPYPFTTAGGIVDDMPGVGFALENQTRPTYSRIFFSNKESGDAVVVHELAHQWFGDNLPLAQWRHIWLNEGFATYAEWLWSEKEGLGTAQQRFNELMQKHPASDPFWRIKIGDPGPGSLFDTAVYDRGAMTVHQLRRTIGDQAFFQLLREWTTQRAGQNVTTDEFVRLTERISGQQLYAFFDTWLFTPVKPQGL